MGYKILIFILIVSVLSISCSAVNYSTESNSTERDYTIFNYLGSEHNSIIFLLNEEVINTSYVAVKDNSIFYLASDDTLSIPLSKIASVEIIHMGKKIAMGIIAGAVAFFVSAVAIALAIGGDGWGYFLATPLGACVGAASLIYGLNNSGEIEYVFNDKNEYKQKEFYKNYHKKRAGQDSTKIGN